jgi:hypothetical protein
LFHLDQELTYHITAKEFVIRGGAIDLITALVS